jgi:hypothetical protein
MLSGYGSPFGGRSRRARQKRVEYENFTIEPYRASRHWAIYDADGDLVCLTVYKRGAEEVVRRVQANVC